MKRFLAILLIACILFAQQNTVVLATELTDAFIQEDETILEETELVEEVSVKSTDTDSEIQGETEGFNWTYDATTTTVKIVGAEGKYFSDFKSIVEAVGADIENVSFENVVFYQNIRNMFQNCSTLKKIEFTNCDTSNVKFMDGMFWGCSSLTSLDLSEWNTSNVEDMSRMFNGCTNLASLNLDGWDTSKVTNMNLLFNMCNKLTDLNLSGWDTSSVKEMRQMFTGCAMSSLDLSSWNISNVTDTYSMFSNCINLVNLNLSNWDATNVRNMQTMFSHCDVLTTLNLTGFKTRSVTNMYGMFMDCKKLTNLDLGGFNTSNVKDMSWMFYGCSALQNIDLSSFDTSNVTNMSTMFGRCYGLTSVDLSSFSISQSVRDMFLLCQRIDTIYTPKQIAEGVSIKLNDMYTRFYDSKGNPVTEILPEHCNTVIKSYIIPVPDKPYKIVNVVSGVHVYWNEIEGIEKYGLWRSETGVDGEYKWIANPTVPHFTDTKVESGKTYYYKVTAIYKNKGEHGDKSESIGITFVGTPDITSRINKAAGVELGWQKINGATGYAIYRKSYSGNDAWTRVATIEGNSTFTWTDTSAKTKNGTIYKYTIRALAGENMKTLSGCRNAGRTMVRLTSQTLKSATKTSATSIKCQWSTSSKVSGYEVRFVSDGKVIKTQTVGNYKTGVKTVTGLTKGKKYQIQVRTYKKTDAGTYYSAWSTAKYVQL